MGNLTSGIAEAIQRLVEDGVFPAGTKLTEKALMDRFGASRGTVRAALARLATTGIVIIHDNRGAHVKSATLQDALDLYDLRADLTAYAARRLAEACDPSAIAGLVAMQTLMQGLVASQDAQGYYRMNIEFHDLLLRGSGNRRAAEIYEGLVREAHLHRQPQLSSQAQLQRSFDEHQQIVDAIEAGDVATADAAARRHVLNGKARFIAILGTARSVRRV